MKTALRDWDALVSIGEMRDSFEIDNGVRNLNSKCLLKILKPGDDRNKDSESGGMGDLKNYFRSTRLVVYLASLK